jgi:hypothetical protein
MQNPETQNINLANEAENETPKVELRERKLAEGEKLIVEPEPEKKSKPAAELKSLKIKKMGGLTLITMGVVLFFY